MKNKRLIGILIAVVVLLCIPLVAMKFSNDIHWELDDFIAASILLFGTGLTAELIMRKVKTKFQMICITILLFVLFLVWAELAVGIFGTPFAGS
ncbi:MAG: hypothetical protein V4548_02940 [Bacteroidota bacterium]